MNNFFDFSKEPGKKLEKEEYKLGKIEISIIIPFYNDGEYIEQSVNCVLNQTYPFFEVLIIDDGSKDEFSLKKLKEIERLDKRIKIFHKENEGLAATRDYGASKASKESKYFLFLDSDDLIDITYLECAYWTLETNKEASWAYSDTVGFQSMTYTWNRKFDSRKLEKENFLIATSMIRKTAFYEVNGFELKEKSVNEDWNFWLKLISKEKFPVHMNYYGQWYRRKETGELAKANKNKKRTMEIINETRKLIKKRIEAIEYPKQDYNYEEINESYDLITIPEKNKNNKINILMIIPWMVTGGADRYNLELIKRLNKKEFNITIVTTDINVNILRQEFEKYSTVYDLTTFLNQKDWLCFINYIIKKENINLIFNTNSMYGYYILPYLKAKNPNMPIIDYVHMEEWYYRNGGFARISTAYKDFIDKTLVCNKHTEKIFINHFKRKKEELQTVYIGVDEEKYNPDNFNKKDIKAKYKIDDNKIIISYICRIVEQKRPFLLLEIMDKILHKRKDILFLIVGDGEFFGELKNEVYKRKIFNNVLFLGNLDDTVEIYSISDININCSIKEGLALTSYESLSMGVPVVSSDVGGQSELINDKVGKIVPCLQKETDIKTYVYTNDEINSYIEAIEEVINKLDYYKNNCRKTILEKFTLNNMAKEMEEVFKVQVKEPNKEKIENALTIKKLENTTKELIISSSMSDKKRINDLKTLYDLQVYQEKKSIKQLTKDILWRIPLWRKLVKTSYWKKIKKHMKKGE